MSFKHLLLNEIEKKEILSQYGLLKEQSTSTTPTDTLNVDVKINFKGGYYSQAYANFKDVLDPELTKVENFLKNGQGKAFIVKVRVGAGESKIPNTDNEKGGVRVEPGFLSQQRMNTIETYIDAKLASYVKSGVLVSKPAITKTKPVTGGPEWIGQPFCPKDKLPADDTQGYECTKSTFVPAPGVKNWKAGKTTVYNDILSGYTGAQYLRVALQLKEIPTIVKQCLDNMKIQINYTDLSKRHTCNSAVYEIKLNGVLLTRDDGAKYASLNNAGDEYDNSKGTDKGGKRYNTFVVSPELASSILQSTNFISGQTPKFSISATCLNPNNYEAWSNGCHKGVGNIIVTNGKGQSTSYESATPNLKGETKTLKNIDACGKAV